MDKDNVIASVPLYILQDLCDMARKSPEYRAGYAWTAVAMNYACRAINHAMIRAAVEEDLKN